VVGPNGHGKTSLIEALVYAEVFRSFRGARDAEVVRFGADGFHVAVGTEGTEGTAPGGRTVACGYDARTKKKRVTVDGAEPETLAAAIGIVRGVVMSPTDVILVSGGPKLRRRWLDVLLALTVRGYVEALGRYRRALAQRARAGWQAAGAFEDVLAESGATLVAARQAWADRWAGAWSGTCAAIGERGESRLRYAARTAGDREALRAAFEQSRGRDRELGQTTVGPHRDDLRLSLDGRALRTYGSAGQQRTAAIALRLVEAATLQDAGDAPVLCLDDAFAELDVDRSTRLGTLVSALARDGAQIVAAVPRESDIPDAARDLASWRVCNGQVTGA